jgi:hypothetical protein
VSSVLVHSCTPVLATTGEHGSEWEEKGESVRGVENGCLGSGEGGRENEGECSSEEPHYYSVCVCVCACRGRGRATDEEECGRGPT